MRLVKFEHRGAIRWGVVEEGIIRAVQGQIMTGLDITDEQFPVEEVRFLAPAHETCGKLICIGLNYRSHIDKAAASGWQVQENDEPMLFMVPRTALCGQGDTIKIARPGNPTQFEAELVIVIGRRAKDVPEEDAHKYILGYTCGNDISDRALQKKDGQWTRAKAFATYKPMGPWIETKRPEDGAMIRLRKNGQLRQEAALADMIASPERLVSFISHQFILEPGDLIFTGTPDGVGSIKPGDEIEVEIDGIGKLVNPVAE
jgi:2-keto-4-pentenoate hydratase/2-oxohepta-3-ene-1,7-dioic acid hydratase in catechol pathway